MAQLFALRHPPSNDQDMKSFLPHQRHCDDDTLVRKNYISMTAVGGLLRTRRGVTWQFEATSCQWQADNAVTPSRLQRQVVIGRPARTPLVNGIICFRVDMDGVE